MGLDAVADGKDIRLHDHQPPARLDTRPRATSRSPAPGASRLIFISVVSTSWSSGMTDRAE